jgi:hypothetical protein
VSIVRAKDKTHLIDILDEIGDTAGCRIREYTGPLLISFNLKVDWTESEDGPPTFDDVSHCLVSPTLEFSGECSETEDEMTDELVRSGFPNYYKYLEDRRENRLETAPDAQDELSCKAALQKDFKEPLEPSLKRRIDQSLRWADAMGILPKDAGPDKERDEDDEDEDDDTELAS